MKTGVISIQEGSSIQNLTLPSGFGFPSNPNAGELYLNKDTGDTYYYNGTIWTLLSKYPEKRERNIVVNGNFDFWRYGTSGTHDGLAWGDKFLGPDRWSLTGQDYTPTISRQAFTPGQTEVPNNPTYFARTTIPSASVSANAGVLLRYAIPNAGRFSKNKVTVSFWAKADASKSISIELQRAYPSNYLEYGIGARQYTIGTTWQKIIHTVEMPAALEAGGYGGAFIVRIWFSSGSNRADRSGNLPLQTGTFDVAQVQVEAGEIATPFEKRDYATELSMCKRFLYVTPDVDSVVGFASCVNSTLVRGYIPFDVELHSTPTLYFNQSDTLNKWSMAVGSAIMSGSGTVGGDDISTLGVAVVLPMVATAGQSGHLAIYGGTRGYKMFARAEL